MRILDPVPEYKLERLAMAPRPTSLQNKVLGVLQNHGDLGTGIMEKIYPFVNFAAALQEHCGVRDVVWRVKPSIGRVAPREMVDDLARQVDVVLTGICL